MPKWSCLQWGGTDMEFIDNREDIFPDLRVNIGSLEIANPVMTASGTFGYAREFENLMNLHRLGAVIVKGISLHPRPGNPPPRIVETACGMLNAIGLQNVGVDRFISEKMDYLAGLNIPVIVNILGDSLAEYREITERLAGVPGVAGIEVNISCPNVKKGGVAFGTDPSMAAAVTKAVKESADVPVMVKLSPNVSDIPLVARAVEDGGADSISLINTLIGMAIDLKTRDRSVPTTKKQCCLCNVCSLIFNRRDASCYKVIDQTGIQIRSGLYRFETIRQ